MDAKVATKDRDMSNECGVTHKTMKEMSPSVAPLLIFLIDEGNSVTLPSFWLVWFRCTTPGLCQCAITYTYRKVSDFKLFME